MLDDLDGSHDTGDDSTASTPSARTLTLRVHRIEVEADGIVSLELRDPGGKPLPPAEPGAHIDLHGPGGLVRQYSLCGDPDDRSAYRIAVLKVVNGRGSRFVHDDLRPGDTVTVGAPRNSFRFDAAARYLFVAGGIGITPLLPMIRAATRRGAPWTLHYCVRCAASAAFLNELAAIGGGQVVLHTSGEGTRLSVEALLQTPAADTLVYCCGPERLMRAVQAAAAAWPADAVRFEWFTPPADAAPATDTGAFEVVCARSGTTVQVAPGTSILEALIAAGVDVDSSCEQGLCGTCEVAVLDGEPDHRDSVLSDTERAAGKSMMICVSRSKGPRLVLAV